MAFTACRHNEESIRLQKVTEESISYITICDNFTGDTIGYDTTTASGLLRTLTWNDDKIVSFTQYQNYIPQTMSMTKTERLSKSPQ